MADNETYNQTKIRWEIEAGAESAIDHAVESVVGEFQQRVHAVADGLYQEVAKFYKTQHKNPGGGWRQSQETEKFALNLLKKNMGLH